MMSGRAVASVLLVFGVSACGYRPLVSATPFGAERLAVLPFLEDEAVGIAPDLVQELSALFAEGGTRLTSDRQGADAVLTGKVKRSAASPTPNLSRVISSYELTVEIDARLVRGEKTVFATTLSATDDYLADPSDTRSSPLATEANRREAVRRLARVLARRLYDRLAMAGLEG
jgi:hypothetical protein